MKELLRKLNNKSMLGWACYDWAHSAFDTVILTFIFAAYFIRQVTPNTESGTMYWGSAVGIAGILVALFGPFLGAIADQKGRLKPWIAVFTSLCAAATAALWFVKPNPASLWLAFTLISISTLGSQFAMIFYNAMLSHLLPPKERRLWSGWGWGMGYFGGLVCLIVIWFGLLGTKPLLNLDTLSAQPIRAACLFTAAWLMIFTLPLLFMTVDRNNNKKPLKVALVDGLKQLRDSLRHVRQYTAIVKFLVAYMFYMDALTTVFVMGGVFAAGTIGMDERQVLLFGITLNISAGIGAFGFAWVDEYFGSKPTILIGLFCLIISACLMLFAATTIHAFWLFGLFFGLFVGPVQAASRSYLSQAAPSNLQTQMFGLYALSGKATSFVGPLMVGWITHWTHNQRIGMSSLIVLFTIGFLLLLTIPKAATALER